MAKLQRSAGGAVSDHPESQYDLLETRHALEGSPLITPRCVVPMKTRNASVNPPRHRAGAAVWRSGRGIKRLLQYQIAVTEAAHNVVLLHL